MRTVLVVDDEPAIRELMAEVLRDEGYAVVLAADGRQGVDVFVRERPDLVLMDVMMPEFDGREAYLAMRALPERVDVPVILMSAAAPVDPAELGVVFLPKPFDLERLLRAVETALGGPPGAR